MLLSNQKPPIRILSDLMVGGCIIILHWMNANSHGQQYESFTKIEASSKEEVDAILDDVENQGIDRKEFICDDSREPENYGYAGGFCSELLSVKDEKGNDMSAWTNDWYGKPIRDIRYN